MPASLEEIARKRRSSTPQQSRFKDPLAELLHLLKMHSVFYTHSELSAPWGFEIPAIDNSLMFHLVVEGRCEIDLGQETQVLDVGDFLLLPQGKGHRLFDLPSSPCPLYFDLPVKQVSEFYETLNYGGNGPRTVLLCGAVGFHHPLAKRLIEAMPMSIRIESGKQGANHSLQQLIKMLADETLGLELGGEAVMTRLADILVVHALRSWLRSADAPAQGWLAALSDGCLSKAMLAIHQHPENAWTVDSLAKQAGMSRTIFSERFKASVGETPLNYLTQWRMELAKSKLYSTTDSILDIALGLGYQSEAAFSRAYKKAMGVAPSHQRKAYLESPI